MKHPLASEDYLRALSGTLSTAEGDGRAQSTRVIRRLSAETGDIDAVGKLTSRLNSLKLANAILPEEFSFSSDSIDQASISFSLTGEHACYASIPPGKTGRMLINALLSIERLHHHKIVVGTICPGTVFVDSCDGEHSLLLLLDPVAILRYCSSVTGNLARYRLQPEKPPSESDDVFGLLLTAAELLVSASDSAPGFNLPFEKVLEKLRHVKGSDRKVAICLEKLLTKGKKTNRLESSQALLEVIDSTIAGTRRVDIFFLTLSVALNVVLSFIALGYGIELFSTNEVAGGPADDQGSVARLDDGRQVIPALPEQIVREPVTNGVAETKDEEETLESSEEMEEWNKDLDGVFLSTLLQRIDAKDLPADLKQSARSHLTEAGRLQYLFAVYFSDSDARLKWEEFSAAPWEERRLRSFKSRYGTYLAAYEIFSKEVVGSRKSYEQLLSKFDSHPGLAPEVRVLLRTWIDVLEKVDKVTVSIRVVENLCADHLVLKIVTPRGSWKDGFLETPYNASPVFNWQFDSTLEIEVGEPSLFYDEFWVKKVAFDSPPYPAAWWKVSDREVIVEDMVRFQVTCTPKMPAGAEFPPARLPDNPPAWSLPGTPPLVPEGNLESGALPELDPQLLDGVIDSVIRESR